MKYYYRWAGLFLTCPFVEYQIYFMFFDYKKGNNLYMVNNIEENYPNLTWAQFAICNDDATGAFEVNPQT